MPSKGEDAKVAGDRIHRIDLLISGTDRERLPVHRKEVDLLTEGPRVPSDGRKYRIVGYTLLSLVCLTQLGALSVVSYLYLMSRHANAALQAELAALTPNRMELSFEDFSRLYSEEGPARLTEVTYDKSGQAVRLCVQSDEPCQFSCEGQGLEQTEGCVAVPFPLKDLDEVESKTVLVAHGLKTDSITIRYCPPKLYAAMEVESKGTIIIYTTLPRTARLSSNSGAHIRAQQGELLQLFDRDGLALPPRDRTCYMLRTLADTLATAPRKSSHLCQLDQGLAILKEIRAGRGSAACTTTSIAARDCLLAAGLQARSIFLLSRSTTTPGGPTILLSEEHATNEVCNAGRWSWFDLTLQVFYARSDGDSRWLSLWKVYRHLHDPTLRGKLLFGVYDPATKQIREVRLAESRPLEENLERFFTADKTLKYVD
jgi:hypothetical protein